MGWIQSRWMLNYTGIQISLVLVLLAALVVVQLFLGAFTVLSGRAVWINSLHVVCGALVLTTSLVLTLRSWRIRFEAPSLPRSAAGVFGISDGGHQIEAGPA